ncbi:hypothetical protein RB195_004865 [Necator americanus]|uniref:Phlebovirus glycoprotein G2 fusion domain-containing protein n=1 Tax=Necator americanus TaxID=51031 RepID=A0ABR1BNX9_NECAM
MFRNNNGGEFGRSSDMKRASNTRFRPREGPKRSKFPQQVVPRDTKHNFSAAAPWNTSQEEGPDIGSSSLQDVRKKEKFSSSAAALTAQEFNVDPKQPKLDNLDDDEIEALRLEISTTRSSLLKTYTSKKYVITDNAKTCTYNEATLYPGQTITWNNLRFSLIGTIVPQLPILSSTFIETDMGISIIKPAHKEQLATHSAGQLQCSTKQQAEQFKCIFASKACTCTHGLREASCLCSPGDMEELMKASPLPLVSKSFIILSRNKQVYAKPNIGSTLHLVAENMKITTHLSNTT